MTRFTAIVLALPLSWNLSATPTLPLAFEPNLGQADSAITFVSRSEAYCLFLSGSDAILGLHNGATVNMRLVGAVTHPVVTGMAPLAATSNYFSGSNPRRWRTRIPNYSQVRVAGVYPGIDIVWYGRQGQIEFDFLVRPGADAGRIQMQFAGVAGVRLDPSGDLQIETTAGAIQLRKPKVLQNGRAIDVDYVLLADNTAGLRIAAYDRTKPLRIDPVIARLEVPSHAAHQRFHLAPRSRQPVCLRRV